MKQSITIGADPELMLAEAESGRIVNAIPILGCDKNNPIILDGRIRMYADNTLLEVAYPPANSVGGAVEMVGDVLGHVAGRLGSAYCVVPKASHVFEGLPPRPDDQLVYKWLKDRSGEDLIPKEWQIGCNPSWDAYDISERKPKPFKDGMRTGSFHVHVGFEPLAQGNATAHDRAKAVRLMDIYVGCASVLFDRDPTSLARKAVYGSAGDYRTTRYGFEYRVLGNYALSHPDLTELVFNLTAYTVEMYSAYADQILSIIDENSVKVAINQSNRAKALAILQLAGCPSRFIRQTLVERETIPLYEAWGI